MFILLIVVTIVFAILWFFILHSVPANTQRFLCRHQWLFLAVHIPVMFMLSAIMGEGMLVGVGSLAGGLLGQIYLAVHGMRRFGLTFLGKKTPRYDALYPPKVKRKKEVEVARINLVSMDSDASRRSTIKVRVVKQLQ